MPLDYQLVKHCSIRYQNNIFPKSNTHRKRETNECERNKYSKNWKVGRAKGGGPFEVEKERGGEENNGVVSSCCSC